MKGSFKVFDVTGTDGSSKCQITTSSGTGKNQNLIFLVIIVSIINYPVVRLNQGF
jgi:hypothetical protein